MSPDEDRRRILLHDALQLFNDWEPDVLVALSSGPRTYTSLLKAVKTSTATPDYGPIERHVASDGTLHRTFNRMVERGLLVKNRTPAFPFRTTYALTPSVMDLVNAMGTIVEWGAKHIDILERVTKPRQLD